MVALSLASMLYVLKRSLLMPLVWAGNLKMAGLVRHSETKLNS